MATTPKGVMTAEQRLEHGLKETARVSKVTKENSADRNMAARESWLAYCDLSVAGTIVPETFYTRWYEAKNGKAPGDNATTTKMVSYCGTVAAAAKRDNDKLQAVWKPVNNKGKAMLSQAQFFKAATLISNGDKRDAEKIYEEVRDVTDTFLASLQSVLKLAEKMRKKFGDDYDGIADHFAALEKVERRVRKNAEAEGEVAEAA
jgi:hypothetical protein